jgi:two-component system cell cycle sensor histidine kinase/response regulator CckA
MDMSADGRPVILNVGDLEANRSVVSRILREEGFAVIEAGTGTEALRKAVEEQPDLVLLDARLPDVDGMEVCRRLKSDRRTRLVPVLHLSATPDDRVMGLESGADGSLTQPVDPPLLVATIRSLLRTRRAEAEARHAAEHWGATFNAISHGVCLLDAEGRVQQANRAMQALLGMPAEEIAGTLYSDLFRGVQPPPDGWPLERARKSGRGETARVQLGERCLEIAVDPITGPHGEFAGAVQTIVDITEQKRSEEERERLMDQLAGERARMEAVLQQMPAGVIIAEAPEGTLAMSNEQAARILGAPVRIGSAVGGFSGFKLLRPDSHPYKAGDLPLVRSLISGEVVINEEMDLVRGDGSRATLLVNSGPIRGRNGFIVAAVVTFYDVTERKELEKELRQSQKMDAVGRLAGGVAHDFNNLLTIISGYGQMIMDSLPPDDPVRRDLEAILEASNRATALTRQLLTFSRRQIVEPRIMDLNRQVARMNRMLRRVIGEDIELNTSLKAASSRIKADPGQIEQVVLNVALNARDAMPNGGRLTIRTEDVELDQDQEQSAGRRALAPGSYVVLSITDTGTGMSPEVLSHAFEPFFTTKAKGKGTGLGLSMVYGIVKQAGGDVAVESEPDKGATVRMYFPVAGGPARVKKKREEDREIKGGTETILVVEDEQDVRRLASEMLRQQGYTVLEAGSGPEAIRLWRDNHHRVDLVLSDVVMPHMSGPEMAAELVKSKPGLKVIYMSGYTGETIARHGVLAQGARFLQKPFTLKTLARKVRVVLDENTSTKKQPQG